MRENGIYWVESLAYGGVMAMLYRDGVWLTHRDIEEHELRVISEPIPRPTPEQLASQAERYEAQVRQIVEENGCDPGWGERNQVDGLYWVRRADKSMELAYVFEECWWSLDWDDLLGPDWEVYPGGLPPAILYGPIESPMGRDYESRFFLDLLEAERRQQEEAARQETKSRSPADRNGRGASVPRSPGATHEISFRLCMKLHGYPSRSWSM